jgi:hypothetical protein
MCPGLSGTIDTLVHDGLCEPQAVNIPADVFLNLCVGLHLDEVSPMKTERSLIRLAASFWTVGCSLQRSQHLESSDIAHASK